MTDLTSLELLYQAVDGETVPLPAELEGMYTRLKLPIRAGEPLVMGNFVTTLDGVASLNVPGMAGGGEISGYNEHDRLVMGILRTVSDAVVVGAGTLRSVPQHLWTAEYLSPDLAGAYAQMRAAMGKTELPLNVIVTSSGELDLTLPVFSSGKVSVLLVTTEVGAAALSRRTLPPWVQVAAVAPAGRIAAADVLKAVRATRRAETVLVEGGPHLMGDFLAERLLDDLFLTLSPQIAGRAPGSGRPALVEGVIFAPADPRWGTLSEVRRAGSHLFLRYRFERGV